MSVRVRGAREDEDDALSALSLRSKAYWGYDAAFLAACAGALRIPREAIARGEVIVAVDDTDVPVGVARFEHAGGDGELSWLYVEPAWIGRGVGTALFAAVRERARAAGCGGFGILADPHAAPFYAARGASFVELRPSDAIAGRELPFYRYAVGGAPG